MQVAQFGSLSVVKRCEVYSVAENLAFRGAVQTTGNMKQSALSASAFADNRSGLALNHIQAQVLEDGNLVLALFSGFETFCYAVKLNRMHEELPP